MPLLRQNLPPALQRRGERVSVSDARFKAAIKEIREFREAEVAALNEWHDAEASGAMTSIELDVRCPCGNYMCACSEKERACVCGKVYRLRYDVEVRG